MTSKNDNNASVPTSASNTPITLDDDESPVETNSDPSVLPITSRHTSAVWSDFKRKRVGDAVKAECNHCSKLLAGGSKVGTTHLKDHLKICPKRVCQDIRQSRLFGTQKNLNDKNETMTLAPYEFHQEDGRRDLEEMIILHEYPISMVEHMGFRKYSKTLQPGFKVPSRNTTRKDIMKRYELEKENVATLLRKAKGKIALTTDMWTADNQRKGYMAVTSHFIDNTWKLQSRILRFLYVPAPHTAEVLADALKESIQSWNLDLRIAISGWLLSPHDYVRKMVDIMLLKYNKYWANVNGLMGVATILDPRYKMDLIRFYFAKFFDEHDFEIEVGRISDLLRRLVEEYGSKIGKTQGSSSQQPFDLGSSSKANEEAFMQEFAEFLQQDKDPSHEISELDKYLDAANVPLVQDFDILNWWKTNGGTYPILQKIARDILSIPVFTVGSESAFSTSGRVLNPYRSRLLLEAVEALMCTQNWIWATLKDCGEFKNDEYAKLVGELEEEFETWDIDSGTSGVCTE
uniref:BED-type domain-containing protein n=1 Tax=Chenopodium quinoa TaxID=63459 RepID=A0A803N0K1_CHEQI